MHMDASRGRLFSWKNPGWTPRVLGAALACLTLAGSLAACDSGGGANAEGNTGETIELWTRDSQQEFINKLADRYNASHEAKVKVTVVPAGNYVQKLGTAAASGSGPDVASLDLVFAPYFASIGALKDISDVAESLEYKDNLSPAHMSQGTWEDKVYALPFSAEASAMYYNKDLFAKAGISDLPSNYAELREAAKKITALGEGTYGFTFAGSCGGCNVFEFTPHIWASGGDVLSDDGSKATFDSPEVGAALQFYRDLVQDGSVPAAAKTDDGSQMLPLFTSGKVGMLPLGAFAIPSLKESGISYGMFPLPGESGGTGTFTGGDVISVMNGARNVTGAEDFVAWATGDEAQTFLAANGSMPVRTDLLPTVYNNQGEVYKQFGDLLAQGKTPYSVAENAIFNDNNGPWTKMINDAVYGSDVRSAQEAGQNAAQHLIDEAK